MQVFTSSVDQTRLTSREPGRARGWTGVGGTDPPVSRVGRMGGVLPSRAPSQSDLAGTLTSNLWLSVREEDSS